ncbi:MAG TPA: peptide ABC transporter substrate-binding protein [Mycobacteriales bacterium]|nr:peptide ABC transporter substrate-binding protein [Mycobacteriales bacterium]
MRARRTAFAVLAAAMLLAGCDRGVSLNDPGIPGPGGFLRIGTISIINSMNPWITDDQLALDTQSDMYPRIIQYNLKTLDFEPAFATKWVLSNHGRTWTFTTRPDAEWSDGKPLTAQDAAWTISTMVRLHKGAAALWASAVAGVLTAVAPNPTTLVVTYKKPEGDALANLEQIPVLPEHVWAKYAVGNGKALHSIPNTPTSGHPIVSGGPFIFVKYTYNEAIVFARNPHYYGPPAHIAGFGVELFSNDDALVAAMRAGEVDAATGDPNLPPTDVRPLKKNGFRIIALPAVAFNDLIINTNPKLTNHRELLNPNVRKAFEYATDRNTIDRVAYLGYAQAAQSIVPPASGKWYDPAVKPLPYDIAKANQLLDAAGYKMGPGGVRVADGHQMSYTVYLSTDNGGEGIRTGQIMTNDFKKIGVKLSFQYTDDDALNDDLTADHYRKFNLAMWGWDTFIDPTYILDAMTCSQWYDNSDSGYCNPTYDKLYKEQGATTNVAKRRKIVYRMQEIVANARPYIVLQDLDVLEAWNPRWQDIIQSPDGWFNQFSCDGQTSIRLAPGAT